MNKDPVLLSSQRLQAANLAFLQYDFGDTKIEATGGWEWTTPGNEITRVIFLAPVDEADSTEKAWFTVRFADNQSVDVIEVYAINYHGGIFGVESTTKSTAQLTV
jgi:hypothetical protein